MPYVRRAGASQSNLLAAYIGAVRRRAGLSGLGDNGNTSVDLNFGGDSSTPIVDTGLTIPDLSSNYPNLPIPNLSTSLPASSSGVTPGTCVGPGCSGDVGITNPTDSLSNIFATLASGAQAGLKIFQQAQGPTNIGGVLYNPATGQYYNPTTGQVVNANGTAIAGDISSIFSSPLLLYGGLALGGILLVSMIGHGR